jgi:hypothetical protein
MTMSNPPAARRSHHGEVCDCKQLAAALGCDPAAISFDFCYRVLQRHWHVKCRHGSGEDPSHASVAHQWKDIGRADAVKAILISNASQEDS